jgi:hypothetical protein
VYCVLPAAQVRYMERDAAELEAAGAGAQHRDVMQEIFLQVGAAGCRPLMMVVVAVVVLLSVLLILRQLRLMQAVAAFTSTAPGSSPLTRRPYMLLAVCQCLHVACTLTSLPVLHTQPHICCLHSPYLCLLTHPTPYNHRHTRPSGTRLWASGQWMTSCSLMMTKSLPGFWPGASPGVLQRSKATAHSQSAPQTWLYPKAARVQHSTRPQGLGAGACQTLAQGLEA